MPDFINTIDVLGDDAVIDSIIDRSIIEFKDDKVTTVGSYAFEKCESLRDVGLPNCTRLEARAFEYCTSLEHIALPKVTICSGESGFNYCTSLTELILPSVTTLGGTSVTRCTALRKVDFSLLSTIQYRTFQLDSSLVAVILRNTGAICALNNSDAFNDTPIANGTGYIYVPSALINSYKTATNWSTYASQFRELEQWTLDGTVNGELGHRVRFFDHDGTLLYCA